MAGIAELGWMEHLDEPRMIYDAIRLAISFVAAVLFITTLRLAVRRARRCGWRNVGIGSPPFTLLSYALLMFAVVVSQIELVGYPLTWRVPVLTLAVAFGALATNDQVKFHARPRYLRGEDAEDAEEMNER